METLVATVLIVVVFMVSSLVLNNVVSSVAKNNTTSIHTYIKELYYLKVNNKITIPYSTEFQEWSIEIFLDSGNIIVEATRNNKTIVKTYANK